MEKSDQQINAETIDRWVAGNWEWGRPISHQEYEAARRGTWNVLLTPTHPVPHEWFGALKGKRILGLASGGGQQMPLFTALGAKCTVLDESMLSGRPSAGRPSGSTTRPTSSAPTCPSRFPLMKTALTGSSTGCPTAMSPRWSPSGGSAAGS